MTRNAVTRIEIVSRKAMVDEADGSSCYYSGKNCNTLILEEEKQTFRWKVDD